MRVLLVEASQGDALLVALLLEEGGDDHFRLTHVETAAEAVSAVRRDPPDVVLLDLTLPDATGAEAVERLRSLDPMLPIVALSARVEDRVAPGAVDAGAQDSLMKSGIDARTLIRSLRDAVRRKRDERELRRLGRWDHVTGLSNRLAFEDRLARALDRSARYRATVGLFVIDIDDFAGLNDSLGPAGGERLLEIVAARVTHCVRSTDTVARLDGDRFAVVVDDVDDSHDPIAIADEMLVSLRGPLQIDGGEVRCTASIGVATHIGTGGEAERIYAHAEQAMRSAKRAGGDRHRLVTADAGARPELSVRLREALDDEQFSVHYQPLFGCDGGRPHAFEALLRWNAPEESGAPISAEHFITTAEQSGLILPLGEWALRKACAQGRAWRARGLEFDRICVNVSARQLDDPDFPERAMAVIAEAGFDPRAIELEITETALIADPECAAARIRRLREHGVRIAIDDFGSGYCSLRYLRTFDFDTLKIDRSIVAGIVGAVDGAIARATVALGRALGVDVVAEGVEREDQFAAVREMGPDRAQGFYLAPPMPAGEVELRYAA